MDQSRRSVVCGVAGFMSLLAGCAGSADQSGGNSTTTEDSDSSGGSNTTTSESTETADPTDQTTTKTQTTETATETETETQTATPADTETVPTGPTNVEVTTQTGDLTITEINANPSGDDRQSLFKESIVFKNTGSQELDISGYTVNYGETGKTHTFQDYPMKTNLPAGQTFRLNSGTSGETVDPAQYEALGGFDEPALSNSGSTITVTDDSGNLVVEATYSPT